MPWVMEQEAGCRGPQHSILRGRFGGEQRIFDTPIDIAGLAQVQRGVAELRMRSHQHGDTYGLAVSRPRGLDISRRPIQGQPGGVGLVTPKEVGARCEMVAERCGCSLAESTSP